MGRIVDYNLKEELAHGITVSRLARLVARELHFSNEEQEKIALAGMLHDIGKLRLNAMVYRDEHGGNPLVVEEMRYVRMHSMLSYEILKKSGFGDDICETVRYHHENYDGSGYPDNLFGESIPLSSRIIRVCDVFSALTADRSYRKRFSPGEALALMIDEINHFDMNVFIAFNKALHKEENAMVMQTPDLDRCFREEQEDILFREMAASETQSESEK